MADLATSGRRPRHRAQQLRPHRLNILPGSVASPPPTLDPTAVRHWQREAAPRAPWLHEEVARRMAERLQWIRLAPSAWAHWGAVRGGTDAQGVLEQRYPQAHGTIVETADLLPRARELLAPPWWKRWGARREFATTVPDGSMQMVWSNMALHFEPDPQASMTQWHRALAVDGFLMVSCFGPDTIRELRQVYAVLGWGPAGPEFTDMHDWGDMLVGAGFAEPVMDMERITLTWADAGRMLQELRSMGANVHPGRFPALRGRGWRRALEAELAARLAGPDGRLALTFEIVYGHALKPAPRMPVAPRSSVSLDDMRRALQGGRAGKSSGQAD
jgi:malonyl-CoA O-methyltransferase